jgi:hypothetical protein
MCDGGLTVAVFRDGMRHRVQHAAALGCEHRFTG